MVESLQLDCSLTGVGGIMNVHVLGKPTKRKPGSAFEPKCVSLRGSSVVRDGVCPLMRGALLLTEWSRTEYCIAVYSTAWGRIGCGSQGYALFSVQYCSGHRLANGRSYRLELSSSAPGALPPFGGSPASQLCSQREAMYLCNAALQRCHAMYL